MLCYYFFFLKLSPGLDNLFEKHIRILLTNLLLYYSAQLTTEHHVINVASLTFQGLTGTIWDRFSWR